ncbi:MAG: putative quinol monooxygenase [Anaerolineaceae bacterium]|nr:putative quinol monooxygenase [Anaerolineaceae bacterium]
MHIVLVHIKVKSEYIEPFIQASLQNAKHSYQEAGVARFDVIQETEDPTRFVLVEIYRTADDQLRHRETKHYQLWRETVTDMMEEPRLGVKYKNLYPGDEKWG